MIKYAIQCGRLPQLSVLELEAVLPRFGVQAAPQRMQRDIFTFSTKVELTPKQVQALQSSLGGTIRIMQLGNEVQQTSEVAEACTALATKIFSDVSGKLTIGVSIWNDGSTHLRPFDVARSLKRGMVAAGASLRFVTAAQNGMHLSAAQLVHNKLAWFDVDRSELARSLELVAIHAGDTWHIGHTLTGQNIASYTKRDFGIPMPDAESGMLPPKLAQIMLNIALRKQNLDQVLVHDPFCGNGRVVLEARLLGVPSVGSDIVPRKIHATQENLRWLEREYPGALKEPVVSESAWIGDAQSTEAHTVAQTIAQARAKRVVIVTEPYLGKPLRAELPDSERQAWLDELTELYTKFLETVAKATEVNRLLVVFARAKVAGGEGKEGVDAALYEHMIDTLDRLGYSHQRLFCYDRPDSFVRRDLVELSLQR